MKKLWPKFIITLCLGVIFIPSLANAQSPFDIFNYLAGLNGDTYSGGLVFNSQRAQALVDNGKNIIDSIEKGEPDPNRSNKIDLQNTFEQSVLASYESTIDKAVANGSLSESDASSIKTNIGGLEGGWSYYYSQIKRADQLCQNGSTPSSECLGALTEAKRALDRFKEGLDNSTKQIQDVVKNTLATNPNLTDAQRKELNDLANKTTSVNKPVATQATADSQKLNSYLEDHKETSESCVSSWWGGINFGNCIAAGIDWIFAIINAIIGIILEFTGWIFNKAIEFSVVDFRKLASSPGITEIWKMIRDLTNIGFIFMLLYAGFMTLFNEVEGKMNPRKIVSSVFIFALLVNFSAAITRTAIDLSNVPALLFYNQMSTDPNGGNYNISNFIIQKSNVAILSNWNYTFEQNAYGTNGGNVKSPVLRAISKGLLTMFLFLGLIYILATATYNFLIRSFILLFLIMTSPVYFIAMAIPNSTIEGWSKRWLKNLKCQCLYAPIYMGGLYLVMALMAQKDAGKVILGGANATSSIFLEIVWFGLILTLLFTVDKLATTLGCEFSSGGGRFESKVREVFSKKGLPARAANATLGRAYVTGASKTTEWLGKQTAKAASSNSLVGRWAGRQLNPLISKAGESGFGTNESNKKRTEGRQTRHSLVMANMTPEQKARYIQGMYLEGAGIEAYNSLSKEDKVDVQLAAQKIAALDGKNLDDTIIGKAKAKLKGEQLKDLEKQIEEKMRKKMFEYGDKRQLVDAKGNPLLDKNKKPITEEIKYESERNLRRAEFLMNQSVADRKIIYESIKSDKDRALLQIALEQSNDNQRKLIKALEEFKQANPSATPEQVEDQRDSIIEEYINKYAAKIFKDTGKLATDTEKTEEKGRMQADFNLAENAKKLKGIKDNFEILNRELPADKRDSIEKEVKKIKREQSKKEIDTLLENAKTAATVTSEMVKKLIEDFKGNLQDLGDLLTTEKVIRELTYKNFTDLRGKNKGMSDNVLGEIDRMIRRKGLEEASPAEISRALNINDPELITLARSGAGASVSKKSGEKGGSKKPKGQKGGDSGKPKQSGESSGATRTASDTPSASSSTSSGSSSSSPLTTPISPEPEIITEPSLPENTEPSPEPIPEIKPNPNPIYRDRPEPNIEEKRTTNTPPIDPNIARLGAQEIKEQQGRNLETPDNNS